LAGLLEHLLVGALALAGTPVPAPEIARAVVRVGGCSGVLVAADGVLTSAHCLNGPIDHVVVDGKTVPVAGCEQSGGYRPGLPEHDLGYCRLSQALPGALAIDDGPPPEVGASISLAGYGLPSAMSRDKPTLRLIATSVVGVKAGRMEVGSSTATACRGDSGGPLLVERNGTVRVAGVIQGAQGAVCASPTEVVPVGADRGWLLPRIGAPSNGSPDRLGRGVRILSLGLLAGAALAAFRWRRRAPPFTAPGVAPSPPAPPP
jgi:hypothetical protein